MNRPINPKNRRRREYLTVNRGAKGWRIAAINIGATVGIVEMTREEFAQVIEIGASLLGLVLAPTALADAAQLKALVSASRASAETWEAEAAKHAQDADYWRKRAEKAEAKLDAAATVTGRRSRRSDVQPCPPADS